MDKTTPLHPMNPYTRLWMLSGQLIHAANIGMWCYSLEHQLHYSTCPQEEELKVFLELSGCLDSGCDRSRPLRRPVLVTDKIGVMWVMEHFINHEDGIEFLVIIGPMFSSSRSVADIDRSLREMNVDLEIKFRMFRLLENIPVVSRSIAKQYASMLHFTMYEEGISGNDLLYFESESELGPHTGEEEEDQPDEVDVMRNAMSEELYLKAIREGNSDCVEVVEEVSRLSEGKLVIDTRDQLRDARVSMIIFCALASRSAIQGGAVLYTAKDVERRYLTEISKARSIDKLVKLKLDLVRDFAELVSRAKEDDKISREVRSCCDYIRANVMSPLSVELLAKRFGYTEYYFTKKFYKEMGVRLGEYIKDARINYAKVLLRTTSKSIDDISFDLQFSNRNYFSKVFHEKVGVTPVVYRAKSGVLSGIGAAASPEIALNDD